MAAKKKTTKKVVEMTKPKPVLRCETVTHFSVEYHDLDSFVNLVTGQYYECVPGEEWGNDSQHSFHVDGKLTDYDQKDWDGFKKGEKEDATFLLDTILNGLCKEGFINPGEYLITVCW